MTNRTLALKRALAVLTLAGLGAYASAPSPFQQDDHRDASGRRRSVGHLQHHARERDTRHQRSDRRLHHTPGAQAQALRRPQVRREGDRGGRRIRDRRDQEQRDRLDDGALQRRARPWRHPDPTKVIKLESAFDPKIAPADHMLIDITPGHGKFEGKAVLTLHFGTLFLSGLLG